MGLVSYQTGTFDLDGADVGRARPKPRLPTLGSVVRLGRRRLRRRGLRSPCRRRERDPLLGCPPSISRGARRGRGPPLPHLKRYGPGVTMWPRQSSSTLRRVAWRSGRFANVGCHEPCPMARYGFTTFSEVLSRRGDVHAVGDSLGWPTVGAEFTVRAPTAWRSADSDSRSPTWRPSGPGDVSNPSRSSTGRSTKTSGMRRWPLSGWSSPLAT